MMRSILRRTHRGTTLIEVLVVIVVFLIGILAIAQIFPGGIKILARTRNQSMALSLARAQVESLKAHPELVPEAVLPIVYQNIAGTFIPVIDQTVLPTNYLPAGTGITQAGLVPEAGRDWQLVSGPNRYRRIIGETHVIPSPKSCTSDPASVTAPFGSLILVERGPIARDIGVPTDVTFQVYGRNMAGRLARETSDFTLLRSYEYLYEATDRPTAAIYLPSTVAARYRVSANIIVNNGGQITRRQIVGAIVNIPAVPNPGYVQVRFDDTVNYSFITAGESIVAVEPGSIQVARVYTRILDTDPFDPTEPFTYQMRNDRLGQILINPALAGQYEERAGSSRTPYVARIDYDVRDWRILHEDFRISQSLPANLPKNLRLPISSIKTNSINGPDGRRPISHADVIGGNDVPNQSIEDVFVRSNTAVAGTNTDVADNFLIIDLASGGQLMESVGGVPSLKIDKSSGVITIFDVNNNAADGLTQNIVMLDGTVFPTSMTNRVLRVYYMGKDEWAVQLNRNPANYTSTTGLPGAGQFYVGGSNLAQGGLPTRIYFPVMDTNRKISIGKIRYATAAGAGEIEGQEFLITQRAGADTINPPMPSIDIRDVVPGATGFVADFGFASTPFSVTDVHGVSVLVKVYFNSARFSLGPDAAVNLNTNFNQWSREWNITTKETYLHQGETAR